jgi:hypothetical protein
MKLSILDHLTTASEHLELIDQSTLNKFAAMKIRLAHSLLERVIQSTNQEKRNATKRRRASVPYLRGEGRPR